MERDQNVAQVRVASSKLVVRSAKTLVSTSLARVLFVLRSRRSAGLAGVASGYPSCMTDKPTDDSADADENLIMEPENSTVDDWFAQDIERDTATAERAVEEAGGDLEEAEKIFEEEREPHRADRFNVPASERP